MRIFPEIGPFKKLATLTLAAALPVFSGCTDAFTGDLGDDEPAYAATIVRGCAVELDHPCYDPDLPGYWLVGSEATLQLSHIKGANRPAEFSLMLRTKPDASPEKPSKLDSFKILTTRYRIFTEFAPNKPASVVVLAYTEKKEGTEVVPVKTDTTGRYIAFERVGERIKVTLTEEGQKLIGDDAAISWADLPPGKKSEADRSAAESEAWRRVIKINPDANPGQ